MRTPFHVACALLSTLVLLHCGSSEDDSAGPEPRSTGGSWQDGGGGSQTTGGAAGTGGSSSKGGSAGSGGKATGGGAGSGGLGGGAGTSSGGSAGGGGGCNDPDGDGYGEGSSCKGADCQPSNPSAFPGAQETCNGQDDNCDGSTDEGLDCREHLWVFVLAGQSNMVGLGFNNELPADQQGPVDGAIIYYNDSIHPNTNTQQWMPLGPGFGVMEDRFGPELPFGRRIRELWPSRKFAIIKEAEGGTALYNRWKATSGDLYQMMRNDVVTQMQTLQQDWNPQIVGFVWMQGESDAIDSSTAEAYAGNLLEMLIQFRVDVSVPIIPTTAGLISTSALWPYSDAVRAGITQVSTIVGQMDTIEAADLPTQASDPAHYTSDSYLVLGKRFADSIANQLPTEWHFGSGLGAAQGDGFWTCRSWNGSTDLMTWDSANQRWASADGTVLIGNGFMHPGANSQAELGWWAPFAGTVNVNLSVTDMDATGGDGVRAEVLADASIWSSDIANGATAQHSFQMAVQQGQQLLFRTSSGALANPLYDTTGWTIDITMTTVAP